MKPKFHTLYFILILLLIVSVVTIGYLGYKGYELINYKSALESEISQAKENIDSLSQTLSQTKTERDDFERKYNDEKTRMDLLSSEISSIQGTVGLLEKLNETDPELLQKYSKVYFLNENYVPRSLVDIDSEYTYNPDKDYQFYSKVYPFLQSLMSAAESDGIDIKIISAYRSFGQQSELKSEYKMVYGSGANQFSADQGYSEHQLGTAVDFTTSEIGSTFTSFEKTEAYQWLQDNAYKYGFILSYPEDNDYYQFEPWHWRFVSRALAERLHEDGKNFYDLDQRSIDQYLLFFFD
jgi:LAS superfamily LD-carboxypeptidase LdcB